MDGLPPLRNLRLALRYKPIGSVTPNPRDPRRYGKAELRRIASSQRRLGVMPLVVTAQHVAKLSVVRAPALACEEREGLLWLYVGEAASAPPLVMPYPLGEAGWFGSITHRDWPVHWSRGIQTALDVAHVPFTHPKSIGTAFGRALGKTPDARIAHTLEPAADGGFRMDWRIATGPEEAAPDAGWVAFHPPNAMSLGLPQKKAGHVSLLVLWSVPLADGASRTIMAARRNFGRNALVPRIYDLLTPVILGEDRRNMETAWPSEVPAGGQAVGRPDYRLPALVPESLPQGWSGGRTRRCLIIASDRVRAPRSRRPRRRAGMDSAGWRRSRQRGSRPGRRSWGWRARGGSPPRDRSRSA